MNITLPSQLQANLRVLAERQGKDPTALVIELLTQSLAPLLEQRPRKTPAFMRFAGIARAEAGTWLEIEADVDRDRALDQQRHLNL